MLPTSPLIFVLHPRLGPPAGATRPVQPEWVPRKQPLDLRCLDSSAHALNTQRTPIRKPSLQAAQDFADRSIDIVFIDAAHEYDPVKEDILAWLPKVKLGGILSGHDYLCDGVKKAVDEIFGNKVIFRNAMENCWIIEVKE